MAIPIQTNVKTTDTEMNAAVKAFAAALAETPEFQVFEEAAVAFRQDHAAQQAVRLFQEKQRSLQMMQQLGLITQDELDELKRLRHTMLDQSSVRAYVDAQNALTRLCQAAAQELCAAIGLDFAGACAPGCC